MYMITLLQIIGAFVISMAIGFIPFFTAVCALKDCDTIGRILCFFMILEMVMIFLYILRSISIY